MRAPTSVHLPLRMAAPGLALSEALSDLQADYDELLFLCRSAEAELVEAAAELDAASLYGDTRELLRRRLSTSRRAYRSASVRLLSLRERAHCESPTSSLVAELTAGKAALADLFAGGPVESGASPDGGACNGGRLAVALIPELDDAGKRQAERPDPAALE